MYNIIYGFEVNIFSFIICILFDYKIFKIDIRKNQNTSKNPLSKEVIYFINLINICDILLIIFPTIILGIYLTFVIKDYEYILTLIKYSIILSSIILYFFSLDIILPKNIEKINYKVSNNIKRIPLNDLNSLKTQMTATTTGRINKETQYSHNNNNINIYKTSRNLNSE